MINIILCSQVDRTRSPDTETINLYRSDGSDESELEINQMIDSARL